jgi:hypothetical protein
MKNLSNYERVFCFELSRKLGALIDTNSHSNDHLRNEATQAVKDCIDLYVDNLIEMKGHTIPNEIKHQALDQVLSTPTQNLNTL